MSEVLLISAEESYKPIAYADDDFPIYNKKYKDIIFNLLPGESKTYSFYYFINLKYSNLDFKFKNLSPIQVKEIPNPRSMKPPLDELKAESAEVRQEAAKILGIIKNPTTVQPLISTLNDENPKVRKEVVRALGKIKDAKAVEVLISALNDNSPDVKRSAVAALLNIGDSRAMEAVLELLMTVDDKNKGDIIEALGRYKNPKSVVPLISILKNNESAKNRWEAASALGKIKDIRAIDPLISVARDTASVNLSAIRALGAFKNPKVVDALIDIYKEDWAGNNAINTAAADALGETGDPKAIVPLIESLTVKPSNSILAAFEALFKIDLNWMDREDAQKLSFVAALKSDEPKIQSAVARKLLTQFRDGYSIPDLIGLLSNENENVRWSAVVTLGELKSKEAVPVLKTLSENDKNYFVRTASESALEKLNKAEDIPHSDWSIKQGFDDAIQKIYILGLLGSIKESYDDPGQNILILDPSRKSNELVETISEQKALEIAKKLFLEFNYGQIEEYKFSSEKGSKNWWFFYTTYWKYKSKRYHGAITVNRKTGETKHLWTGEIKYDDSFLKSD